MKPTAKFKAMLGPAEEHPVGSVEWAERIGHRLQIYVENVKRNEEREVKYLPPVLTAILDANPRPWAVWPPDNPCRTPEAWFQAVTGERIASLKTLIAPYVEPGSPLLRELEAAEVEGASKTPRSRDDEAGFLYEQGAKAVRAGGYELNMLASHLRLMLRGTVNYPGALWQTRRVPPDGLLVELDRFADYLLLPVRRGLGLPSLHFLRLALNAMPDGPETLQLVRDQFAQERMDFDALADRARDSALLSRKPKSTGRPEKGTNFVPLSKGGIDRQAAQLAKRRPDLADQVRAGKLKLSTALIEAGIRKKPTPARELTALDKIEALIPSLGFRDFTLLQEIVNEGYALAYLRSRAHTERVCRANGWGGDPYKSVSIDSGDEPAFEPYPGNDRQRMLRAWSKLTPEEQVLLDGWRGVYLPA
jgi:hypothetical protein